MKRDPRDGTDNCARFGGARCLIVEARFYDDIADELLKGALRVLKQACVLFEVVTVPGALEIPAALVITTLSLARARAIMDIAVARGLPLGNGILTVDTHAQARERAEISRQDKGGGAAKAALALLSLKQAPKLGAGLVR
jgi:6,7-dimethyl-8-ribityllumazine synthase